MLYFKENYRLIPIDLSKQAKLKDLQRITFIGKLEGQNNGVTMFFIIEKSEETCLEFLQNFVTSYKNGNTKDCKFVKQIWEWILKICNNKKWYFIDSESKGVYTHENPIKFLTSSLEPSLCNYSGAYVLVTGTLLL